MDSAVATDEFVTVREAAKLLRVNGTAHYDAIGRGEVAGIVRLGRPLRVRHWALGKGA